MRGLMATMKAPFTRAVKRKEAVACHLREEDEAKGIADERVPRTSEREKEGDLGARRLLLRPIERAEAAAGPVEGDLGRGEGEKRERRWGVELGLAATWAAAVPSWAGAKEEGKGTPGRRAGPGRG